MKNYLITYTSQDEWETSLGVMVVSARNKNTATKIAKKEILGQDIKTVKLLKSAKEKILFDQQPSIQ